MDSPPICQNISVSYTSLISALNQAFNHSEFRSVRIDSSTSITLRPVIEPTFVSSVWEHGRRREEDQLLLVLPTHAASSTPFFSAVSQFPGVKPEVLQALNVLMPFLTALTPDNLSQRFHNGIQVSFSLNSSGEILSTRLSLSRDPIRSFDQLLNLPRTKHNRVFDAFYYMLLSQQGNAKFLSLKESEADYDLLSPSGTYRLPSWVQISDDDALAQDWYDSLQQCGFKGFALRGVMSALSGILLLGNVNNPSDVADGASLLGLDPELLRTKYHAHQVIVSSYKLLLSNVIGQLNTFLANFDVLPEELVSSEELEVVSVVNIVECPSTPMVKYKVLSNVFDDNVGINREIVEDGLVLPKTSKNVSKALKKLQGVTLVPSSGYNDIPNLRSLMDDELSYLAKDIKSPSASDVDYNETSSQPQYMDAVFDLSALMESYRIWTVLSVSPFSNAQAEFKDEWTGNIISSQIREYFLKEWIDKRRNIDFTVDFENYEFLQRYSASIPPDVGIFQLEDWVRLNRQWSPAQFSFGNKHLWINEDIWRELEESIDGPVEENLNNAEYGGGFYNEEIPISFPHNVNKDIGSAAYPREEAVAANTSEETAVQSKDSDSEDEEMEMDYLLQRYQNNDAEFLGSKAEKTFITEKVSRDRRLWVSFVWALTFWIPSPLLKLFGMSRPDVRMAWREKLTICFIIFLINGGIVFYMIFLGDFVCTDYDKVWSAKEVGYHQGSDDYYVSIHGNVYDMTKFFTRQHSDNGIKTTSALMLEFAGLDISDYFPPPLTIACPNLVTDKSIKLSVNSTKSPLTSVASHESGSYFVPSTSTKLHNYTWYNDVFTPSLKQYYKGRLVATKSALRKRYTKEGVYTFVLEGQIYDVTNYFLTISDNPEADGSTNAYNFFDSNMVNIFESANGGDITHQFYSSTFSDSTRADTLTCLKNAFAAGKVDFRQSAKCQAANYILLVMAGILTLITVVKFLTSLRFGSKARPSAQDKFVICQIPAYTEDEDALRLSIDSLTDLDYDNRRKLLLIICDGMIIGNGNDRPTPNIVLDLLGVNYKIDPPSLLYHSVGEAADQVNCAKVYSGLYEHDGNVVPFMTIVKVGRPDEKGTQKAGNRGKRDSQILVLDFLNRVHYQKPMSPLHLEMFHHLNNIIGVDPELYEYLFMVDADTAVAEDSLTRLVAHCSNDSRVAGTCGETNLQNENKSLATMIQVYEYFISHHLTKAFESLFGSVTCLPGCFSLYRLRGTKRQKPLIMSNEVIREYSVNNIDTLHKKNLFSLGEDRYLTTLMAKHFPKMKFTFVGDAKCYTEAPEKFSILLSQRRRWINSTVHNLVELLKLESMCGFCLVGMRGVVFVDLVGTIMLPAVVFYLGYLLYRIISGNGPLPIISIILIAAVYGLQTLVYVFRRQWQHIGWMLIYIMAYPIHSFLLPIYSFWNMDNFTWGNTRKVLEMKDGKQFVEEKVAVIKPEEVEMETWNSYAVRNGLAGAERRIVFDNLKGKMFYEVNEDLYDLADMGHVRAEMAAESMYSKNVLRSGPLSDMPRSSSASTVQMSQIFNNNRASRLSLAPTELGNNDFDVNYELQIRSTIKDVLSAADLDTMTKRQLRQRVEDILGIEFIGDKIVAVDNMIDEELEQLDFGESDDDISEPEKEREPLGDAMNNDNRLFDEDKPE